MYQATKKKVHGLLHPEIVGDSGWDKIINIFIIVLILLNVTAVMLETVPSIEVPMREFFHYFDIVSVIIFSIEYILRVWSSNHDPKYKHSISGRLRYMVSPAALIDLIAILPSILLYMNVIRGVDLRELRLLRLLRFFRLFRLTAYSKATKLVVNVFKTRFHDLLLALVYTLVLILLSSFMVYFAEHNANPNKFTSIPETIWWAVETISTIGYGDIIPITPLGKFFTIIIMLAGIALLALPSGIITAGFMDELRKMKKPAQTHCPHCGKPLELHEDH